MPWQSQVNAVVGEVNPDGSWRYPTVIVSVPRQSGKTALVGAQMVHRLLAFEGQRLWYTAQTGLAAIEAFNEWQSTADHKMPGRFHYRRSAGQQGITFKPQNSRLRIFPPTPDSLMGRQSDLVVLDECYAFTEEQGDLLLQAVIPTQATRKMRQTWIVSTAGSDESTWLRRWIEKGRDSLDNPDTTIAFFEWSAEDNIDLRRPESWPLFHPAYALTQSEDSFKIALDQLGDSGFSRAYGNRWNAAAASWRQVWPACQDDTPIPVTSEVVFGVDSCPRHSKASIVAAGALPDQRITFEVVDQHEGVEWVLDRAVELSMRQNAPLIISRSGPLGYLISDLEKTGARVQVMNSADYGDAISRFQTAVVQKHVAHRADPRLDASVQNILEAAGGDRPTWRRRDQRIDISPAVAAAQALWALEAGPALPQVF